MLLSLKLRGLSKDSVTKLLKLLHLCSSVKQVPIYLNKDTEVKDVKDYKLFVGGENETAIKKAALSFTQSLTRVIQEVDRRINRLETDKQQLALKGKPLSAQDKQDLQDLQALRQK